MNPPETNPAIVELPPAQLGWHRLLIIAKSGDTIATLLVPGMNTGVRSKVYLIHSHGTSKDVCPKCGKKYFKTNTRVHELYDFIESFYTSQIDYMSLSVNKNDIIIKADSMKEYLEWEIKNHEKVCPIPHPSS